MKKMLAVVAMGLMMSGCQRPIPTPPFPVPTTTTTTLPPVVGCKCNFTYPLSDPNPSFYTEQYMADHSSFEECGIEAQLKIIARFCVYRPSIQGWWFISSLVMDKISRNSDGSPNIHCFVQDGYQYHIKGYRDTEPSGDIANVVVSQNPTKYIICECRKVQ